MEHAYNFLGSICHFRLAIIFCYEEFEHNDIIEITAAHFFQKKMVVKSEMCFD